MRSKRDSQISVLLALLRRSGFSRRYRGLYLLLAIIFLGLPLYFKFGPKTQLDGGKYTVADVIDGDTIALNGVNTHIRYLEIDAPEILHSDSPGDPLAEEARDLNRRLVSGRRIRLEFDKEKYDPYGRGLAYVFADGVFVNEEIVREGLARAFIIKPNEKYADRILRAEEEAKRQRKGIWGDLGRLKPPPEDVNFLIKPSQAPRYIDQRVVVRGKITDSRKSNKVIVLKMEGSLDIAIFPDSWENFRFFGINPETYYVGRPVEVIGKVRMYKGRPEIVINHPMSIRTLG